jgi:hypothetical protein
VWYRCGRSPESPAPMGQDRRRGDGDTVGYYASYVHHANLYIRNTLQHGTGAKRRPRREGSTKRGHGHYKGRSPKAPAPYKTTSSASGQSEEPEPLEGAL